MVTMSPTWPQRTVPPVLIACAGLAGAATVAAATGAAVAAPAGAVVAAAAGGGAVVAAGLAAAGAAVGAAGAAGAAGPHAARSAAPVADTSKPSAAGRLTVTLCGCVIGTVSRISFSPDTRTLDSRDGRGQSAPADHLIASADVTVSARVCAPQSVRNTAAKSRKVAIARVCGPPSDHASAIA